MYRSQIFRALIFCLGFLSSLAKGLPEKEKVDIFAKFNQKVQQLELQLGAENNSKVRYRKFLNFYREISDLRMKNPRQKEEDEIHMSDFMDSLAPLPVKNDFEIKKCTEYKSEIIKMSKTYSREDKDPYVERALKIVDLICR